MRNAILTLPGYPGSTLTGVRRIPVDEDYLMNVISKIKDPVLINFWEKEFAGYSERLRSEAIAPIQNKVGEVLSSSLMRNIIGQKKSSVDVRDVMDNQKIPITNLA